MSLDRFLHVRLEKDTLILPFRSSDRDLNEFLYDEARDFSKSRLAVTYLLEDINANKTAAYFSLLNDKLILDPERKSYWNRLNRKIANPKRQKSYPAVKIGRLAVDEDYTGEGIGKDIIDFVKFIFSNHPRSGCRFITVDAYSEAVEFYLHNGFSIYHR